MNLNIFSFDTFFFSFSVSVLSHFDALAAPGVPVSYYVYSLNI